MLTVVLPLLILLGTTQSLWALWEGFYREKDVATSAITFNSRSFFVHGKPVYLYTGEIHYPRVPKELWRDRLMRIKRAGYNTIAFYTVWNFHEPIKGEWQFEENLDVEAWLNLIKELGMYAIVRPGPYICAEVDFGGFAPWTVDVEGMSYRHSDPEFLAAVDGYYEGIFPKFIKHQIHKGGPVIAVQLENEYYDKKPDEEYKNHLINKAYELGLEVPYIWSKCKNAHEPKPGTFPNNGKYPWFATELWTGWIGHYATSDKWPIVHRAMKRIIAAGTGGLTHYMIHGGTNFGYTASDDQRATSYDYAAPIGELGQFRETYYTAKKYGLLTQAFNNIIATSKNGNSLISKPNAPLRPYVQKTDKGNIAFIHNEDSVGTKSFKVTWNDKNFTTPTNFNWSLKNGDVAYFITDAPVTNNATIAYSATRILTQMKIKNNIYFVLYGKNSSKGEIAFSFKQAPSPTPTSPWSWDAEKKLASIQFTYPSGNSIEERDCAAGNNIKIKLLIMNESFANKTWVDSGFIVCNAEYVDENNKIHFTKDGGSAYVFTSQGKQVVTKNATTPPSNRSLNSGWKWVSASAEAATDYNDASWKTSTNPRNTTYYGWVNGYGWYRTTHSATSAGTDTLTVPYQGATDKFILFVNGKHAGTKYTGNGKKEKIPVSLKQGSNQIAICMGEYSRHKSFNHYKTGPKWKNRSGLFGNVKIGNKTLTNWRFRGGFEGVDEKPILGTISSNSWTALKNRQWNSSNAPEDNMPKFWRYDFNYSPPVNGLATWVLKVDITSKEIGVVWLNGHCLGRNIENQPPLFVPQCWLKDQNSLIVFVENGKKPVNYELALEEYRSFAETPVGIVPNTQSYSIVQRKNTFKVTGDRFVIPKFFVGKSYSTAVYDLSGRLIQKQLPAQKGILLLGKHAGIARGVYIVRLNLLKK